MTYPVPPGWQLLPIEPTEEMRRAGSDALAPWIAPVMHSTEAYYAMRAAAPKPPEMDAGAPPAPAVSEAKIIERCAQVAEKHAHKWQRQLARLVAEDIRALASKPLPAASPAFRVCQPDQSRATHRAGCPHPAWCVEKGECYYGHPPAQPSAPDAMREALEQIAGRELSEETLDELADFVGGHDECVRIARKALAAALPAQEGGDAKFHPTPQGATPVCEEAPGSLPGAETEYRLRVLEAQVGHLIAIALKQPAGGGEAP